MTIQDNTGLNRNIQDYTELYMTIKDYIEEFGELNRLLDRLIKTVDRHTQKHSHKEFVES